MRGSRGATGGPDPTLSSPGNRHKAIGFLMNTGPDPWKIIKLPATNHRPASDMQFLEAIYLAFRWQVDDGPLCKLYNGF